MFELTKPLSAVVGPIPSVQENSSPGINNVLLKYDAPVWILCPLFPGEKYVVKLEILVSIVLNSLAVISASLSTNAPLATTSAPPFLPVIWEVIESTKAFSSNTYPFCPSTIFTTPPEIDALAFTGSTFTSSAICATNSLIFSSLTVVVML